jgi:integrase
MRFGEIAGLEWTQVDLDKGVISLVRQFTHGAWSELKPENSRRKRPIHRQLSQLKAHRLRTPGELVLPSAFGNRPIDYHNSPARVWAPLLKKAKVEGTFHMLRHFLVTSLIQSGVNAKVAQTLAGHLSPSFTLDQYAGAVPQQLEEAGEKVATVCSNRVVAFR